MLHPIPSKTDSHSQLLLLWLHRIGRENAHPLLQTRAYSRDGYRPPLQTSPNFLRSFCLHMPHRGISSQPFAPLFELGRQVHQVHCFKLRKTAPREKQHFKSQERNLQKMCLHQHRGLSGSVPSSVLLSADPKGSPLRTPVACSVLALEALAVEPEAPARA